MKGFDARDQAFELNEEAPSYDLDMSGFVPDLGFHHIQVKTRTALVRLQPAKTLASYLVVRTNTAQLKLSLQKGNPQGKLVSNSEI